MGHLGVLVDPTRSIDRLFGAVGTGGGPDKRVAEGGPDAVLMTAEAAARAQVVGQVPGVQHSRLGLAHDRMHGGVKGRRMSKKDKLRAAAAAAAAKGQEQPSAARSVQSRREPCG